MIISSHCMTPKSYTRNSTSKTEPRYNERNNLVKYKQIKKMHNNAERRSS